VVQPATRDLLDSVAVFFLGKESEKREVLAGSQLTDLPRCGRHARREDGREEPNAQAHYVVDRGAHDGADYGVRHGHSGICGTVDDDRV
jgi:hypothetical protein